MKQSKIQFVQRAATGGLALSLMLALCACGANASETSEPVTPVADETPSKDSAADSNTGTTQTADTSETAQTAETSETAQTSETDETQQPSADEEAAADEAAVIISEDPASPVTVTMQTETPYDTRLCLADGTEYYTADYSYPVVSIAGNDAAAQKINDDILANIERIYAGKESNKSDAESFAKEVSVGMPCMDDISYGVQRADDRVISFTVNYYSYAGGAHGYEYWRGAVYDAQTGEKLAFDDLSDDPEAFHTATLAYNQKLAATDSYSERIFSADAITDGTLENVLYGEEDVWYLSDTGLVFVSDTYDLGSYADGAIEFCIPYAESEEMGLKDKYAYEGRMRLPLEERQETSADLNGDGTKETVSFYTEAAPDNTVHLIIGGADYTDTVAQVLPESAFLLLDLVLYDLNTEDDSIELALYCDPEDEQYSEYSFFFRYGKDKSLLYLGKTKGSVAIPLNTFTELLP